MDNLKKYLDLLIKYQVWVVCAIVLLVAVLCWWFATAGLAKQFNIRKGKLDGLFRNVVVAKGHPNQNVIDKTNNEDKALKQNVFNAWEILYREQRAKNEFPKVLGEDFKVQFNNLNLARKDELSLEYRARYQNFILQHLQTLPKEIDARRPVDETKAGRDRSGGARGDTYREEEWTGVVDWNDADRTAFEKRFEWQQTPSTFAVVVAQEDLWVYEVLLRAIKNANEGATYANAVVKRIGSLKIGSEAVAAWHEAEEAVVRIQGGASSAAPVSSGSGGLGGVDEPRKLMDARYVDDKGQALPATPEYPFVNHPNKEFKMLPIQMSLIMDQRRLPKLLVECANSNMPIEVRRVRLLKTTGGALEISDENVRASAAGQTSSSDGGRGGFDQSRGDDKVEFNSMDVPIEIQGVICIYNPPDAERLGVTASASDSSAGKPATPVQPAKP
ncbi:MAG: hypothetical protein LLF97_13190 [Planctomycetaceae bacterium]|nr:hypothetical protein [Planctomycetaceae bacterium]